jgi:hypothetical protein
MPCQTNLYLYFEVGKPKGLFGECREKTKKTHASLAQIGRAICMPTDFSRMSLSC